MESGNGVTPQAVFVETNWVVDVIAPAHLQSLKAIQLLEGANSGLFDLPIVPTLNVGMFFRRSASF